MTRLAEVAVAFAVVTCCGCEDLSRAGGAKDQLTAVAEPQVSALELVDRPTEAALQEIANASEPEVELEACGDLLKQRVTLRTTERKPIAVVMAMLVTQLGAPAGLNRQQWTLYCDGTSAPGKLFRKNRPPAEVTVPTAPE